MASWYPYEDFKQCWANVREGYGNSKNTWGYGILEWLAGSKRVQVKGGMLLLAAHPWKTPTGKAVRKRRKCFTFSWQTLLIIPDQPQKGKKGAPEETGVMLASEKIKGKIQVIRDG